jgi:hypothetical protein
MRITKKQQDSVWTGTIGPLLDTNNPVVQRDCAIFTEEHENAAGKTSRAIIVSFGGSKTLILAGSRSGASKVYLKLCRSYNLLMEAPGCREYPKRIVEGRDKGEVDLSISPKS